MPDLSSHPPVAHPTALSAVAVRTSTGVRAARPADLPVTARLHVDSLPIGLFPDLGPRFVARWHQAHIESAHGVALVAYETTPQGEWITGFLVGSTHRAAFRHELLTRHRRGLLVHGLVALLARPPLLARFLRTRLPAYLRRLGGHRSPTAGSTPRVGDLTAIAVDRSARRGGTGHALSGAYLSACVLDGTRRAELVTDVNAAGTADFYARAGWFRVRTETTRDGRRLLRFAIDLHGRETR